MEHLHEGAEGFNAQAAAAWEAYQAMLWKEIEQCTLTPEMGKRLCDALSMVAWFHGYQAGRREPLRLA